MRSLTSSGSPSFGAVLRAVELPELGGDTLWVDAGRRRILGQGDHVPVRLPGVHELVEGVLLQLAPSLGEGPVLHPGDVLVAEEENFPLE